MTTDRKSFAAAVLITLAAFAAVALVLWASTVDVRPSNPCASVGVGIADCHGGQR